MNFTELELNQSIQKAIKQMGFTEATPIQEQAIPVGLKGKDIIGCAQTGTGKTAAFLIPAMERLLKNKDKTKNPGVVILAPTRELVIQVTEQAKALSAKTSLRPLAIYGGSSMKTQINKLRRGVDIVIATPGRLLDHIRRGNIDFKDLQILILDEADRMLDMGFMPDIKTIVKNMPKKRQTMLFSATMPKSVLKLTRQFQQKPVKIEIGISAPPKSIRQTLYPISKHLKMNLLIALLEQMEISSMLVFTATKQEANIVTRKLKHAKIRTGCIHGDFRQRQRVASLEGFRSGKYQVLVATNIASRGLDVEGISHVINYDVPDQAEDYVHRIGRTARAEAEGDAITLVTSDDESMIHRIEYLLNYKIERKTLPGFDYNVPTPSWAKPSSEILMRQATKSRSLSDRFRSMSSRRRR